MLCAAKQITIRNISGCFVSSFKYQLDKLLNTIPDPDIPCVANYDNHNSLENSSHTIHSSLYWCPPYYN